MEAKAKGSGTCSWSTPSDELGSSCDPFGCRRSAERDAKTASDACTAHP